MAGEDVVELFGFELCLILAGPDSYIGRVMFIPSYPAAPGRPLQVTTIVAAPLSCLLESGPPESFNISTYSGQPDSSVANRDQE